jgi:RNA polymerase sigma factor (sigma-70 family)
MSRNQTQTLTTDLLSQYLAGVGYHDLLTAEDEVELAQKMEAGHEARRRLGSGEFANASERRELEQAAAAGDRARTRFIEANLRLVVANARHYTGPGVDMLDLIQEGNVGLITAVEKFDWRKGFKFSTYATWWIRQAMQRARASLSDTVQIPSRLFDLVPLVRATAETIQTEKGRAATVEEIAEESGVDVDDVRRALEVGTTVALETPVGDEGAQLGDFVADEELGPEGEVELIMASERLEHALAALSPFHRRALEVRFGLVDGSVGTIAAVAEEIGIPKHQVNRTIEEALEDLARNLNDHEDLFAA